MMLHVKCIALDDIILKKQCVQQSGFLMVWGCCTCPDPADRFDWFDYTLQCIAFLMRNTAF